MELNRAVAIGMALGSEAGLRIVEPLADAPSLRDTRNERERVMFLDRAASYGAST